MGSHPQRFPAGRAAVLSSEGSTPMSLVPLFANSAFDPETINVVSTAFDTAWQVVSKSGSPLAADPQAASARDLLAKRIIEMAQRGERDPHRLVDDALVHLVSSN